MGWRDKKAYDICESRNFGVRFTRLEERCRHIIARLYYVRMLRNRRLSRNTEQGQLYIYIYIYIYIFYSP